jgi:hypothetical protein
MQITFKTNELAIVSFVCGLIALVSIGAVYSLLFLWSPENLPEVTITLISSLTYFPRSIYLLSGELSVITGILALNELKIAGGMEKGKAFAWIGIILGAGVILFQLSLPIILRLRS